MSFTRVRLYTADLYMGNVSNETNDGLVHHGDLKDGVYNRRYDRSGT